MIRTSVVFVSVALISCLSFGGAPPQANPADPLELIIPTDSLAVVEVVNAGDLPEAVASSSLGEVLDGCETIEGLLEMGEGSARVAGMLLAGTPIKKLRDIFNGYAAVVLLDVPEPGTPPPVVMVAHVANRGGRLEEILRKHLRPALIQMDPDVRFEVAQHEDVTVTTLRKNQGPGLSYAFVGAYWLLGTKNGVEKFLSKVKAGGPTLAKNPDFKEMKKKLGVDTGVVAWLDAKGLRQAMADRIKGNPRLQRRFAGAGVDCVRGVGFGMKFTEAAVLERVLILTEAPRTGGLRLLPDGQKEPFGGAALVPRDFTVFAGLNLGSGQSVWQKIRDMIADTGGPAALERFDQFIQAGIEAQLGFDTRAGLVSPLSGEIFIAADARKWGEIVSKGAAPSSINVPFVFGAKLLDKATFEKTLMQILRSNTVWQQLNVETVTSEYHNVEIRVLEIPGAGHLSPSFAFLGDYVLVSLQDATLKAAIDASANKQTLATRSDYAKLGKLLPDRGCVRVFADAKGMLPGLLEGVQKDMEPPLAQLAPELMTICRKLDPVVVSMDTDSEGIWLDIASSTGSPGMIGLVGIIGDTANRTYARIVAERMVVVAEKLEAYRKDNNTYPNSLSELVPKYINELPRDVFSKGKHVFAYSPGPLTESADKKMVHVDGWLLASPGPDESLDIDIETFTPEAWDKLLKGDNLPELKRKIYRYKPKLYEDERSADDEGDIFLTGPAGK